MKELLPLGYLDGLRALFTELGGDFDELLSELQVGAHGKVTTGEHFPHRKLIEMANLAARKVRRNDFGLMWGVRTNPMILGPLSVAMLNAPTPRHAIELFARHLPKQNSVLRGGLVRLEKPRLELFSVVNQMKRPPSLVQVMERNIGALLRVLRTLLGESYVPVEVWISHAQNASIEAYRRAYGVTPRFEQSVSGFVMKRADLDHRVPDHRKEVYDMAVSYLDRSTPPSGVEDDMLATAVAILATNRTYTLSDVAGVMGVHVRGLQRRLSEAGVTYSMLKDRERRDEAERLLLDRRRALIDIALELGFRDQAAFTRASRRWFGAPPTEARRQLAERLDENRRTSRTDMLTVARRMRSRPEGV